MNFLKIAWKDISSIFKNRFIRVSVAAIIIVPLLYSLLYLAAFWDPYSRLNSLPVAVVNMDKGAKLDDKDKNFGNDLVDKLKENTKIGWKFVSYEDAMKGVEGKDYYAVFVIPEDFSSNVLSAKDQNPKKAEILYKANEKRNFLAAQINGKVLVELKAEITKGIVQNYTEVAFDSLTEVKDGMKQAADGSKELADGSKKVADGNKELADGLGTLSEKVPELKDGVTKLYDGSSQLKDGVGQLISNIPQLSDGVTRLYGGASQLNNGQSEFNSKLSQFTGGVTKSYGGSSEIKNGMGQLVSGLPTLTSGVTKLYDGSSQLRAGLLELNNKMPQLTAGVPKLYEGSSKLSAGLSQLSDGLGKNLTAGATKLNEGSKGLSLGSQKLDKGSKDFQLGASSFVAKSGELSQGVNTYVDGVNKLLAASQNTQKVLNDSVEKYLKAYLQSNPNAMTDKNMQAFLATMAALNKQAQEAAPMLSQLQNGGKSITDGMVALNGGVKALSQGANDLSQGATQFSQGATEFAQGATTLSSGVSGAVIGAQALNKGAVELNTGLGQLNDGIPALAQGSSALYKGATELNEGLGQLNSNVPAVSAGANRLFAGISQLNDGLGQLDSNVPAVSAGASKLLGGASQLNDGLGQLNGKIPSLSEGGNKLFAGASQLNDGLGQLNGKVPELADGVTKLNDGATKLSDGATKVADGNKELNTKLTEGSDKLNKNLKNDSKTMGEFVSEPLVMNEKPVNPVKDYGTGFAPYFISLSLWIGALMMFFIVTDKVDGDIQASSRSLVLGKFLSYGYIGTLQAILASVVVLALGLKPANVPLYFLFNILLSFVFIAIMQSLIFLLGQVGRLLSIILLILQLTACAGTFPLEVVPKFFKVINPFMPFTYSVSGLRELISGVDYAVVTKDAGILIAAMVVFLAISIVMKDRADRIQQRIMEKKEEATTSI